LKQRETLKRIEKPHITLLSPPLLVDTTRIATLLYGRIEEATHHSLTFYPFFRATLSVNQGVTGTENSSLD